MLAWASGRLGEVVRAAGSRTSLLGTVAKLLEPALMAHVRAADLESGILVLVVDSPVWATRLRFAAPALIGSLQGVAGIPAVADVRIVVRSGPNIAADPGAPRPRPPSRATADSIDRDAASLPDGDPVRDALQRIAARARERGDS